MLPALSDQELLQLCQLYPCSITVYALISLLSLGLSLAVYSSHCCLPLIVHVFFLPIYCSLTG